MVAIVPRYVLVVYDFVKIFVGLVVELYLGQSLTFPCFGNQRERYRMVLKSDPDLAKSVLLLPVCGMRVPVVLVQDIDVVLAVKRIVVDVEHVGL